jgi:hypothetical protein
MLATYGIYVLTAIAALVAVPLAIGIADANDFSLLGKSLTAVGVFLAMWVALLIALIIAGNLWHGLKRRRGYSPEPRARPRSR